MIVKCPKCGRPVNCSSDDGIPAGVCVVRWWQCVCGYVIKSMQGLEEYKGKRVIAYEELPNEAFVGWASSASSFDGSIRRERTMIPFSKLGECQREHDGVGRLVYYEDDFVVFDMRGKILEGAILDNKGLMAQVEPAMKCLRETPKKFFSSLIPWKSRKTGFMWLWTFMSFLLTGCSPETHKWLDAPARALTNGEVLGLAGMFFLTVCSLILHKHPKNE